MANWRSTISLLAVALLFSSLSGPSSAQTYPSRTIRYVVPSSPGGGADVLGRIIATGLTKVLEQQVIVDNRAGASGNIAAELVASAPADGYTLLQANIIHAANVSLFKKLSYDVIKDFAPVTQLASSPAVVVVHPSLPAKSIKELIALAKKQPMAINFSSAGPGSSSYLAAASFLSAANVKMLDVPYRGGGLAITGVITGETSVMFSPLGSSLPLIDAGKLRPLAVTTKERFPAVPDYPTVAEAALPGYEFSNWYGLVVPAKTPSQVIATLHSAVVEVLKNPDVDKRMKTLGYVPVGSEPVAFGREINSEIAKLRKIVKDVGMTAK